MDKIKQSPNNNRNFLVGAAILVVLAALFGWSYFANTNRNGDDTNQTATESSQEEQKEEENQTPPPPPPPAQTGTSVTQKKYTEKKSAHFVSSNPANNALLTTAPGQVAINFNFDLGAGSTIEVVGEKSGDVVPAGPRIINNLRTLTIPVEITASDNFQVTYKACWPDGSCHDGSFGFTVNLK